MASWPRIYAQRTLNGMYKKLTLREDEITYLHKIFNAAAEFYRTIELNELYKIISFKYNRQIPEAAFVAFTEIARHEAHNYSIISEDEIYKGGKKDSPMFRMLVLDTLVDEDFEEFYEVDKQKYARHLEYNILPEEELLKYEDAFYYEHTPAVRKMIKFLKQRTKLNLSEIDEFMSDIVERSKINYNTSVMNDLSDILEHWKFDFDMETIKEFCDLWLNIHNTTKLPILYGHSPSDLRASRPLEKAKTISIGPNLKKKLSEGDPFALEMAEQIKFMNEALSSLPNEQNKQKPNIQIYTNPNRKIGRNDPCPCGSGKKYKNCCGK